MSERIVRLVAKNGGTHEFCIGLRDPPDREALGSVPTYAATAAAEDDCNGRNSRQLRESFRNQTDRTDYYCRDDFARAFLRHSGIEPFSAKGVACRRLSHLDDDDDLVANVLIVVALQLKRFQNKHHVRLSRLLASDVIVTVSPIRPDAWQTSSFLRYDVRLDDFPHGVYLDWDALVPYLRYERSGRLFYANEYARLVIERYARRSEEFAQLCDSVISARRIAYFFADGRRNTCWKWIRVVPNDLTVLPKKNMERKGKKRQQIPQLKTCGDVNQLYSELDDSPCSVREYDDERALVEFYNDDCYVIKDKIVRRNERTRSFCPR